MKQILIAAILIAFTNSFIGCSNNDKPNAYSIQQMPEILQISPESFRISAQTNSLIVTNKGTEINIPANAFSINGQPVSDSVVLEVKQFDDPFEIFASGIPMQYDSAGTSYTFKSAGMISIAANMNGTPVQITEGESINISMASQQAGTDYNLYYFDTIQGQWQNKGKDITQNIDPADTAETNLQIAQLSNDSIYSKLGIELKKRADIIPMKFHDKDRFKTFQIFGSVAFQAAPQSMHKMDEVMKERWIEMELDSTSNTNYMTLILKSLRKTMSIDGTILLDGEPYSIAMKSYAQKKKEYEQRKSRLESLNRLRNMQYSMAAQTKRTFNIQNLGTWNCDAAALRDAKKVELNLKLPQKDLFVVAGIAYPIENAVMNLLANQDGTYSAKLLNENMFIYACDTMNNPYIGVITKRRAEKSAPNSTLKIKMRSISNPALFFDDLQNQINQETIMLLMDEGNETLEKEEIEETVSNIKVYPVPADQFIKLDYTGKTSDLTVLIINSQGIIAKQTKAYRSGQNINIDRLPDGMYTVRATSKNMDKNFTETILIKHQ